MKYLYIKKYVIFFLSFLISFTSCKRKKIESFSIHGKTEIFGLATPVNLDPVETKVYLTDYFNDVTKIDSVICHSSLQTKLSDDKKELVLSCTRAEIPWLSELQVKIGGEIYSILVKKSRKIKQTVSFASKGKIYESVQIAGEMNNWNPANGNMSDKSGNWEIELWLNPGKYQYQLVVDGVWMLDPANPETVDNNMGGFNSLLVVTPVLNEPAPVLYTKKYEGDKLTIGIKNKITALFVYWQNYRMEESSPEKPEAEITITIPQEAGYYHRSYIRILACNESGISNDLLLPFAYRNIITKPDELKRDDFEASIIYFLLVDRFYNGQQANDHPLKDKDIAPQADYYGGDLAGITQKIREDYFSDIGINMLWISPIVQNPLEGYVECIEPHSKFSGYHGYWPIATIKIDHRFGTDNEFQTLIDEAHDGNINVILDFVANHVHEKHPVYQEHPDWATELILPDGRKNLRLWDEQRLTTWFDTFLPTFDLFKPEVIKFQSDSALYWIQKFELDGFRHDATKHIPEVFWRSLTKNMKDKIMLPENKKLYQIGETFGSRELIGSYVGSGMLNAQFDFNLYFDTRTAFAVDASSFKNLEQSLNESLDYYGRHHLMGNITGNHDIARFISYAGEALKFSEDDKEAGWTRNIKVENPVGYKKLAALTAFIMTVPGIPVIYYGDEIGMPGAGDPDNRRPMKFDNLSPDEKWTKETVKKLVQLRKENITLIFGDYLTLKVTTDEFVYARTYFDKTSIIIFNKSSESRKVVFEVLEQINCKGLKRNFSAGFGQTGRGMTVKLRPYSFEILSN
ncbi:MAG: alpha-amylase [Bacteroidia bacterium]|nr:alpha-amylase [Bacteroidia bacterium]